MPPGDEVTRVLTIPAPGEAELREEPPTGEPGPAEVAGATVCSLVSPGTETMGAFRPGPERPPRYPVRPGYAVVFCVEEIGAEVEGIAVGDLVYGEGGHRSRQRHAASRVARVPAGLDPFDAVFARMMAIPLTTLATTAARPGGRVGVSGLGIVGHLAAAIFARCGYEVTGWDPRESRQVLAPNGVRVSERAPEAREVGERGAAEGFELVLECSGHDGAALDAVRSVRAGGEVVLVGTPWTRRTDATAQQLLHEVFHRYAVLRSGWEWRLPRTGAPFTERGADENLALALRWLLDGEISVAGLARRVQPIDARSAYEALADGSAEELTVVFDWTA